MIFFFIFSIMYVPHFMNYNYLYNVASSVCTYHADRKYSSEVLRSGYVPAKLYFLLGNSIFFFVVKNFEKEFTFFVGKDDDVTTCV